MHNSGGIAFQSNSQIRGAVSVQSLGRGTHGLQPESATECVYGFESQSRESRPTTRSPRGWLSIGGRVQSWTAYGGRESRNTTCGEAQVYDPCPTSPFRTYHDHG